VALRDSSEVAGKICALATDANWQRSMLPAWEVERAALAAELAEILRLAADQLGSRRRGFDARLWSSRDVGRQAAVAAEAAPAEAP